MLDRSARIIGENIWFYLVAALLIMALETVNSLGFLGRSSHIWILFVFAYLSANLPLVIVHGLTLTGAARHKGRGRLVAGFKVALIVAIIAGLTTYVFLEFAMSKAPGVPMSTFDYLAFVIILTLALPAVVTLLGSWVPAGLMRKAPRLLSAIGRGVRSIHTVYWRLVLSLGAYVLVGSALGAAYVLAVGRAPLPTMVSGGIDAPGIAYWYLTTLLGMFLATYVNVVVCMDYMRIEKIDLETAARATIAQS